MIEMSKGIAVTLSCNMLSLKKPFIMIHKELRCTLKFILSQPLYTCEDGRSRIGQAHYFKFRPANLMFGFNSRMLIQLQSFAEFNSLRKNQLLRFYRKIKPILNSHGEVGRSTNKYRQVKLLVKNFATRWRSSTFEMKRFLPNLNVNLY